MKELKNVIEYLQDADKNGNYTDILQEIHEGDLSITDAKIECIAILKRWQVEEIAPNDIKTYNRLQNLIDSIK